MATARLVCRPQYCRRATLLSLQKIEEPVRSVFPEGSDSGAQNFGASQGEADDFLKSKTANQDTEILGTEIGVADAMRFKGAGRS